jgi:hypothetical protein
MSTATESKKEKAAETANTAAKPWWSSTVFIARFSQVFVPDKDVYMVQAVEATGGKLLALKATKDIYRAVAGKRYGTDKQMKTLGIRKLAHVNFLGRMVGDVMHAVDVLPATFYNRGTAPTGAVEAREKGFRIRRRTGLGGYEPVLMLTDGRGGEIQRHCVCVGMTAGRYRDILDFLHTHTSPGPKSFELGGYKVVRQADGEYLVRAIASASDEGEDMDSSGPVLR